MHRSCCTEIWGKIFKLTLPFLLFIGPLAGTKGDEPWGGGAKGLTLFFGL